MCVGIVICDIEINSQTCTEILYRTEVDIMAAIYVNARAIIERINEGKTEVIVQVSVRDQRYEFPGGQVEFCESFFDAVKREVKEETGLDIIEASGQDSYIKTDDDQDFAVECFRPWAVYQIVKSKYYDSMGVLFKCKATGEPLAEGDGSRDIKWIGLNELQNMIDTKGCFCDVSRAAALFYLKKYSNANIK